MLQAEKANLLSVIIYRLKLIFFAVFQGKKYNVCYFFVMFNVTLLMVTGAKFYLMILYQEFRYLGVTSNI